MKPNELMIGDWVEYGQYITTVRSLSDKIVLSGCIGRLDEVRPVPITPEILEANGIRHYKDCGRLSFYKRIDADFVIRYEIYAGYIGIELCDGNRISVDRITKVHELQHVLRLIGMNDLADEFKLKEGGQS